MRLYDMDSEKEFSLSELKADYIELSKAEPWNHADNFSAELYVLLMDTINGRNNCEIMGYTGKEISNLILSLRSRIS